MSINNYDGDTFVAFLDISGFKEMMRNEDRAWRALDRLYNTGYLVLRGQGNRRIRDNRVEGLFISDSGVLFVRKNNQNVMNTPESLKSLLIAVRTINDRMLEKNFMLTTSIAFGRFKYQERIEFEGIGKDPIYGYAYVSAFLDNENGKPKIQPGQYRIVKENLPEEIIRAIENNNSDDIFRLVKERSGDNRHYYFYWMVNIPGRIERFEQRYTDAYSLKYQGMLRALKEFR